MEKSSRELSKETNTVTRFIRTLQYEHKKAGFRNTYWTQIGSAVICKEGSHR